MALTYRVVQWTRQKRVYDLTLAGAVVLYLATFLGLSAWLRPHATAETLLIRAFGTLGLLLLHVVLCIGPLCRLDRRFLPLLHNRRHLGVVTFLAGAAHGTLATVQFHALGEWNPLVSLLAGNPHFAELSRFPFQTLGLAALLILFLMAATSHDFWLAHLTAPVWKALHMGVYVAYGALVLHVALGALQAERASVLTALLGAGFVLVTGLHVAAGLKERRGDRESPADDDGWVRVGRALDIPLDRARIVCAAGERIAVFRSAAGVTAMSNVCQHQNGPLGEGKIVDGCVTCPWHGFQYRPESGASPPPFTERVPVFRVRLRDGVAWVDPRPLPGGTELEPARLAPEPAR